MRESCRRSFEFFNALSLRFVCVFLLRESLFLSDLVYNSGYWCGGGRKDL